MLTRDGANVEVTVSPLVNDGKPPIEEVTAAAPEGSAERYEREARMTERV